MPERPEVWYGLGHAILTDGPWIGMPDINGAASAALRRALQRNPSYVPALGDLLEIACSDGDTTQVRALAARYLARDSTGEFADYYRWRVATTLADTATLTSLRRRFDTFSEASLHRIITVAQIEGLGTAEALRAVAALRRTSDFGRYLHFEVLQNAGRFRDAAEARRMTGGPEPRSTPSQRLGRTVEALYWTGDTMRVQALLERAAPRLDARPVRRDADPADTVFYDVCALGIWRLARGETRGVAHLAALLHNVRDPMRHFPTAYIGICAAVMDAALAAAEHSLHAALRLQRLDSLMATGPLATTWPILAGNLTAARLFERAGRLDAALVALGRRVRLTAFGDIRYLVALPLVLREEGRLMALTGDTASAIRAYRRYLALRDTPDLAVRPEVDSVRSALARLKKRT